MTVNLITNDGKIEAFDWRGHEEPLEIRRPLFRYTQSGLAIEASDFVEPAFDVQIFRRVKYAGEKIPLYEEQPYDQRPTLRPRHAQQPHASGVPFNFP